MFDLIFNDPPATFSCAVQPGQIRMSRIALIKEVRRASFQGVNADGSETAEAIRFEHIVVSSSFSVSLPSLYYPVIFCGGTLPLP